jgi:hypothetical protein
MANVLSVENAVQAEENAVQAEEIAVQVEEIARLRGLLETHTSHGNQRVNHENVLEPKDIVDHSSHGTLCSLLPTSTPTQRLRIIRQPLFNYFFSLPILRFR